MVGYIIAGIVITVVVALLIAVVSVVGDEMEEGRRR